MKKWEKPQVFSLGLENTYEESTEFKAQHYCHSAGGYHDVGCGPTHPQNNGCNDPNKHPHNEAQKAKCCCPVALS